jgi:hypothetical protein
LFFVDVDVSVEANAEISGRTKKGRPFRRPSVSSDCFAGDDSGDALLGDLVVIVVVIRDRATGLAHWAHMIHQD